MTDELTLSASGRDLSGWQQISVTLHAEAFPPSFEVSLSSRDPITSKAVIVKPGDSCTVKLGKDTVITGYIDRVGTSIGPEAHALRIVGRGKTQDLVDCSAEWDSGQIPESTAFDIATKLAKPYGIAVKLAHGAAAGPKLPPFPLF